MSEQRHEKITTGNRVRFVVAAVAFYFSLAASAHGASWSVANGDWSVPANWGGTEPTSTTSAYIDNNGTANITLAGECCSTLYIGQSNTGSVQMSGGTLSADTIYAAYAKTGAFSQSGGVSTLKDLYVAYGARANGTYDLTDTGQLVTERERIGYDGTGTFNHSGGTNRLTYFLDLGERVGSNGTYNLSGTGHLIAGWEDIGEKGQGTVVQTGGVNQVSDIYLGRSTGSSGTYELSGDGQLSGGYENIGYYGVGTILQSGGTNTCHTQYVGFHNRGEYNHSAGTNSVTKNFYLGYSTGGSGTYNLSGTGYLSAKKEVIGASGGVSGLFIQSGGTNSSTGISITTTGEYRFTGGVMEVSGGLDNRGKLDFGGGAGTLRATGAIVNLAQPGGILQNTEGATVEIGATSLLIVPAGFNPQTAFAHYDNAGFLLTAGTTLVVPEGRSIIGCGAIPDRVDCRGSISVSSGSYDALRVDNGITISGAGSVKLGYGDLTVEDSLSGMSGGTLSCTYHYVGKSGTGSFSHSGGSSTPQRIYLGYNAGATGSYALSGTAHVDASTEYVGYSGKGTIDHTAGVNEVYSLYLGQNSLSEGTYSLAGSGQLTAINEYIGYGANSKGTFNHSAGSNTIVVGGDGGGDLILGNSTGSQGTYNLSGTGELLARDEFVGYSGTGIFNQSGGTNTVDGTLYLGSGTYNLTGGTLAVKAISAMSGFNFGGGTLKANASFSTDLPLNLTGIGGDATIDTGNYRLELTAPLTGTGGLVKRGDGVLTLSRPSSGGAKIYYSGNTVVQGGILEIAAGIAPTGTSLLDIESGEAILKNISVNKSNLNIVTTPMALFDVESGVHVVGTISGGGTTRVLGLARLTALSISQDSLVIGGFPSSAAAAVPEPSFPAVLLGAVFFLLARKAKRCISSR
jgi:hypothetical protein